MTFYLVELPVPRPDGVGLERAMRTLHVAQNRLSGNAIAVRLRSAGITKTDARLVCLVEAQTAGAVRNLFELAFLPAGRIREVSVVDLIGGQDPSSDLGPAAETELVEDVVDMRLHGSLGDE